MSKYTKQFKLGVVKRYQESSEGYKLVGQHYGIDPSFVSLWVKRHQLHGAEAFDKKLSTYSAEFKLSVLQHMWDKQISHHKVSLLFDIRGKSIVSAWERQYHSGGIEGLIPGTRGRTKTMPADKTKSDSPVNTDENRSREEILEEVNYLRMENAYLKKLKALVQKDALEASLKKRK